MDAMVPGQSLSFGAQNGVVAVAENNAANDGAAAPEERKLAMPAIPEDLPRERIGDDDNPVAAGIIIEQRR